jgi:hypothetical protein
MPREKTDTGQKTMTDEWEIVNQKPFWKPESESAQIEGVVTHTREVPGEFGVQQVVDVGEFSVGISAGLNALPAYEGRYVRITYQGFDKSKKGRDFKKFLIEVRKANP